MICLYRFNTECSSTVLACMQPAWPGRHSAPYMLVIPCRGCPGEWNGMRWDGMEWDEMRWNGVSVRCLICRDSPCRCRRYRCTMCGMDVTGMDVICAGHSMRKMSGCADTCRVTVRQELCAGIHLAAAVRVSQLSCHEKRRCKQYRYGYGNEYGLHLGQCN